MDDIYSWGMFSVEYLCERYGENKIAKLIRSHAPNFSKAMEEELRVTLIEFEDGWKIWLGKRFGVEITQ